MSFLPRNFLLLAMGEAAVGALALVLSRTTGIPLVWSPSLSGLALGVLTALGFFALLWVLHGRNWGWVIRLRHFLELTVAPLFRGFSLPALAVVSALAGWGEESLFRGWLFPWLSTRWGWEAGGVLSALAFGLAHPFSVSYVVWASAIGGVLAGLQHATGGLLAPTIAHGLYDFLALFWLTHRVHKKT